MTPKRVCQSINNILAHLRSIGLVVDYHRVSDKKKQNTEVSFNNADLVSEYRNKTYPEFHAAVAEQRMFTGKFFDDSFVQIQYVFNKKTVLKHRLAFLPPPQGSWIVATTKPSSKLDEMDNILIEYSGGRQFRFDFDLSEDTHVNVTHPKSHLTLIDNENCRIPVSSAVTPYWFFHFIVQNFYSSKQQDLVSGLPKLTSGFPSTITKQERQIPHLVIPK